MKYILFSIMAFSTSARAEFFKCSFTEPFFSVFLTTQYGFATIETFDGIGTAGEQAKIVKKTSNKSKTVFKLANGATLTVDRNEIGSDGMSDLQFPYTGTYVKGDFRNVGGCEVEMTYLGSLLERLSAWNSANGQSLVNFWPGEYGQLGGYRAKVKTTIAAKDTWGDLRTARPGSKDCTIRAKKEIIPIKGERGETYSYLTPTARGTAGEDIPDLGVKKGEKLTIITPLAENYCVVEANGKLLDTSCPDDYEETVFSTEETLPGFGNWANIRCEEGHMAWIHEETLAKSPNFEFVQYGYDGDPIE